MRCKSAFTLIELLIVVAIIAILAAIAVPNLLDAQARSKVSRCYSDMRTVAFALQAYATDNNKYPQINSTAGGSGEQRTFYLKLNARPPSTPTVGHLITSP